MSDCLSESMEKATHKHPRRADSNYGEQTHLGASWYWCVHAHFQHAVVPQDRAQVALRLAEANHIQIAAEGDVIAVDGMGSSLGWLLSLSVHFIVVSAIEYTSIFRNSRVVAFQVPIRWFDFPDHLSRQ